MSIKLAVPTLGTGPSVSKASSSGSINSEGRGNSGGGRGEREWRGKGGNGRGRKGMEGEGGNGRGKGE